MLRQVRDDKHGWMCQSESLVSILHSETDYELKIVGLAIPQDIFKKTPEIGPAFCVTCEKAIEGLIGQLIEGKHPMNSYHADARGFAWYFGGKSQELSDCARYAHPVIMQLEWTHWAHSVFHEASSIKANKRWDFWVMPQMVYSWRDRAVWTNIARIQGDTAFEMEVLAAAAKATGVIKVEEIRAAADCKKPSDRLLLEQVRTKGTTHGYADE